MIKYENFKGKSFNSESEYNESMDKLLNQPINSFTKHELNNFIDEFFRKPLCNDNYSDELVIIDVDVFYEKVKINFTTSLGDKYGEYYIKFHTKNFSFNGDILLKDFESEVRKLCKEVLKNWKKILKDGSEKLLEKIEVELNE